MRVTERIERSRDDLTPAERAVAEVVLADPEAVAFGTVARLAERAGCSGPTVLRMAAKAGFDGFAALQAAVQEELASRLRPAAERIRGRPAPDPLERALEVELENVHATLSGIRPDALERGVARLARADRVGVLSGDASAGIGSMLASDLGLLRDGVEVVDGSPVRVARRLAGFGRGDALVAIDLRRYERWVLDAAERCGAHVIALTDSVLSPLAEAADEAFVVDAQGVGPFDSHVGTLALCNALMTATATKLRTTATKRLDRIEQAWRDSGVLSER